MFFDCKVLLIFLMVPLISAQFYNCDYNLQVQNGEKIIFYNPNYNMNYKPSTTCRWTLNAPYGKTIHLQCVIDIPKTNYCKHEYLIVVTNSNKINGGSGYRYCGAGTVNRYSVHNKMIITLTSDHLSKGGNFYCKAFIHSCSCGRRQLSGITGGIETGMYEFTMMAGIYDYDKNIIGCGGTIISEFYVTTAAHCVYKDKSSYGVVVGKHKLRPIIAEPFSKFHSIKSIKIHEKYNNASKTNDIALIRTALPIKWNLAVGPACLPFKFRNNTFVGKIVDVAGWGTIAFANRRPQALLKVALNVITFTECKMVFPNIIQSQICTKTPGKDTCQYDSGGGLYYEDRNSNMYLVGIVAYGLSCAMGKPSVNTRIINFLDWIEHNTPGATYCKA